VLEDNVVVTGTQSRSWPTQRGRLFALLASVAFAALLTRVSFVVVSTMMLILWLAAAASAIAGLARPPVTSYI
jgi:hypothetical protein